MSTPSKVGELYSRLYVERGDRRADSARVRTRLGKYLQVTHHDDCFNFQNLFTQELGVEIPYAASWALKVGLFFAEADVSDVLSAVTLVYRYYDAPGRYTAQKAKDWRDFVERVLREENIAYSVDVQCGVHPIVDAEYERNVATAVAGLAAARYAAARAAFESAVAKFSATSRDSKGAIRDTFEALETMTKLISASGKALTSAFVKSELEPRIQKVYVNPVAQRVAARLAQSFADWVDAAHPYRHGHEAEEPVTPPDDLAVLLVSQGASFLRWLADFDRQANR